MSGRAPVRVKIGVLSLAGVSRPRGAAIGAALQAELARVLGSEQVQSRLRAFAAPTLDGGRMTVHRGERAERMGARIATQITGGLLGTLPARGRR